MARDQYRPRQVNGKRVASPEYRSWQMMKERAKDSSKHGYAYSISMDPRWESFDVFIDDMGQKPDPFFTLERINTKLGYTVSNCKWASREEQARNREYCRINEKIAAEIRSSYAAGGVTQNQLASRYGVTQGTISQIVRELTWRKEVA